LTSFAFLTTNPSNPSFNKEATADAHEKAIAFLKAHM
jgi:carboxymethylenebutenolidase